MLMAGDLKCHRHKIFVRSAQIFVPHPRQDPKQNKGYRSLEMVLDQ